MNRERKIDAAGQSLGSEIVAIARRNIPVPLVACSRLNSGESSYKWIASNVSATRLAIGTVPESSQIPLQRRAGREGSFRSNENLALAATVFVGQLVAMVDDIVGVDHCINAERESPRRCR